jgi:sirohydrochlorin ferrochelatase
LRPGLDVGVGLLDHGPPYVEDAPGAVAVPLLLSSGYHVRVDLPAQAPSVVCAAAVGPDPLLAAALADRLAAAGYDGSGPVTLAAASAGDDVRTQAAMLASRLGVEVTPALVSELPDLSPAVVASYLLAPGVFHDAAVASGAAIVSAPLGAHPALAELVLARYDAALTRSPIE